MTSSNALPQQETTPFRQEVAAFLANHPDTETVDLLIADINGVLRGKRINASSLTKVFQDGVCLPPSALAADITGDTAEATGLGFEIGDMDLVCMPVPGTLRPVPWQPHPSGQLILTMLNEDGSPFPINPREILKSVVARLHARGLFPVVAVELEFYLTDYERDADNRPQPPICPATGERNTNNQIYGIAELDGYRDFIYAVADAASEQQIPADAAVAEFAPGQFEINLHHRDDAVAACDDGLMLKRLIKGVAERQDMVATFMAKPYEDQAGSGTHIHISLLDANGRNVFNDIDGETSPLLTQAIAGLQAAMAESMLIFAPHANSYHRFVKDAFVPLSPCWGYNNRTVALRIPAGPSEATRIEHRVAGADANPYLVTAALLAGIEYGINHRLTPTAETVGNAYTQEKPSLPRYWTQALETFRKGRILPEYLGAQFCHVLAAVKDAELDAYQRHISTLEYEWYWRAI